MLTQPYRFGWFDRFCLWYPPGWLILFNRHWQHYKPDGTGWNWLEYGLFLLPFGFYLALALRWLRLKLGLLFQSRSPAAPPNHEPDPAYQKAFQQEILEPIAHRYFRATFHQAEQLSTDGPLMIVMNHAGMCFPWDFVCLGLLLSQRYNWFVQPLAHPIFFDHPWLRWWLPAGWAEMLGGIRAERESFAVAVHEGEVQKRILLYAPEGWRGLSKGWWHRYRLATFDPSFLRLSVRDRVPVLPVICLGSESLHPFTVNVPWLARRLGMPLFPVSPLVLVFVLFPSMGVWAMRSRLHYFVQPLEYPWEQVVPGEKQTQTRAYRMANALRSRLQSVINQLRQDERERKG